jgi:hypothetical protein
MINPGIPTVSGVEVANTTSGLDNVNPTLVEATAKNRKLNIRFA